MWSTRKRNSGSRLDHDKLDIPAFDTVSLNSNLGSPRRNYFSIITTDINVLNFRSITSKRLLKLHHWWLKNKERKVDFRFVKRKFLAAINLTGSAEGVLVPVLLRITHWTKSGLPVSPPGLFPPCRRRRRRAYAPTSNTASHDNHEKINSWISFSSLYEYGAPLLV